MQFSRWDPCFGRARATRRARARARAGAPPRARRRAPPGHPCDVGLGPVEGLSGAGCGDGVVGGSAASSASAGAAGSAAAGRAAAPATSRAGSGLPRGSPVARLAGAAFPPPRWACAARSPDPRARPGHARARAGRARRDRSPAGAPSASRGSAAARDPPRARGPSARSRRRPRACRSRLDLGEGVVRVGRLRPPVDRRQRLRAPGEGTLVAWRQADGGREVAHGVARALAAHQGRAGAGVRGRALRRDRGRLRVRGQRLLEPAAERRDVTRRSASL